MSFLPFGQLPPFVPRRFLPADLQISDWERLEPLFDRLERRARECGSVADLQNWLVDWGELSAALEEESARRYIGMTCHTEDAGAERAYIEFVETIEPRVKPRHFGLQKIFLEHPLRAELSRDRYGIFDRRTAVQVELFREENVPLETEEAKLSQQYQKLSGSLTVHFRGEERTLVQMGRYLEEPDRSLRREAWELVVERRLREAGQFEDMFDQLLGLRERIAHQAGSPDYRDHTFRSRGRFDYTPADCLRFHEAVESEVMPALRELQAERRETMGLDSLRPWDLAADALHRPPLRPFKEVSELLAKTQHIFDDMDPALAGDFRMLQEMRLVDLDNRRGKAPGGYQSTLAEARVPFIFMNAVGIQRDLETLLHEAGHAFHALATRPEEFYPYRNEIPLEFCEVASMSMELLGNEHLESFYSTPDARRARRDHLEGILKILPWIATVDAFQHWIYTHPGHSSAERQAAWVDLMKRFGGDVDWSGLDEARANLWHRQLHIFIHPFYYIEYGIAQLGALQVWRNARADRGAALTAYKRALARGGARPLPELFQQAGCRFDFGRDTLAPLVDLIRSEMAALA